MSIILHKCAFQGDINNRQQVEKPPYNYKNTLLMKSKY